MPGINLYEHVYYYILNLYFILLLHVCFYPINNITIGNVKPKKLMKYLMMIVYAKKIPFVGINDWFHSLNEQFEATFVHE